jgi:hypothetical protein
MLFHPSCVLFP